MELDLNFQLSSIINWFNSYVKSFQFNNIDQQEAFDIKISHSFRVQKIMQFLSKKLKWSEIDINIAEIVGILHDLARFEQYSSFNTFDDSKSFDHGDFAVKLIQKHHLIDKLPPFQQKTIILSVQNHNKKEIPNELSIYESKFVKLIRDADKLDIFHFVCPYYLKDLPDLPSKIKLSWPHKPKISSNVVNSFLQEEKVDFSKIQFVNDFKIAQLAWIYDFNYYATLDYFIKHSYGEIIINSLPIPEIKEKINTKYCLYLKSKSNLCSIA